MKNTSKEGFSGGTFAVKTDVFAAQRTEMRYKYKRLKNAIRTWQRF